jgi:hypothetical protein
MSRHPGGGAAFEWRAPSAGPIRRRPRPRPLPARAPVSLPPASAALGASSLTSAQVARELRRLGLKFGSLPEWLAPRLAALWAAHKGRGAKGEDLEAVARELPGGWTPKQVKKLLRSHHLPGGGPGPGRRGRRGGADSDGWESELEGGDPLLEAERAVVEDLYARHLADDDYLEKVRGSWAPGSWREAGGRALRQPLGSSLQCAPRLRRSRRIRTDPRARLRPPAAPPPQIAADLPAELSATPAAVLATLRFFGIAAKPPPGKRRAPKPRRRGGGGEGRARCGARPRSALPGPRASERLSPWHAPSPNHSRPTPLALLYPATPRQGAAPRRRARRGPPPAR